jgi:hypothetical protein
VGEARKCYGDVLRRIEVDFMMVADGHLTCGLLRSEDWLLGFLFLDGVMIQMADTT